MINKYNLILWTIALIKNTYRRTGYRRLKQTSHRFKKTKVPLTLKKYIKTKKQDSFNVILASHWRHSLFVCLNGFPNTILFIGRKTFFPCLNGFSQYNPLQRKQDLIPMSQWFSPIQSSSKEERPYSYVSMFSQYNLGLGRKTLFACLNGFPNTTMS